MLRFSSENEEQALLVGASIQLVLRQMGVEESWVTLVESEWGDEFITEAWPIDGDDHHGGGAWTRKTVEVLEEETSRERRYMMPKGSMGAAWEPPRTGAAMLMLSVEDDEEAMLVMMAMHETLLKMGAELVSSAIGDGKTPHHVSLMVGEDEDGEAVVGVSSYRALEDDSVLSLDAASVMEMYQEGCL